MTPESKEKAIQNFAKFKATGKICGIEFTMRHKDGSTLEVTFDGRLDYDKQGHFIQTHCILENVTEKKKNAVIEESFRHIFENSLNEIFVFDAETFKFIKVNRGACKNIGYTQEELTQLTPVDIKPEMSLETFVQLVEPLRTGAKEIIQFETIHQRKNGSSYFVEIHLQLTHFLTKPAFIAIILDITQRKEIENRLNLVIEGAELGYWDWNYVSDKLYVNNRWLEILGLQRSEIDNHVDDWANRLHPDDIQRVYKVIEQSIKSKQPFTVEFRMRHQQGHWTWIQGSGAVVAYDIDNHSALRLCGTHQDISVRKQNEAQIKKLSQAVEQSPNLVIITDTTGNIEYVNPKILELTGYFADEVIGKNIRIFSSGKTTINDYRELWDTLKSGKDWRGVLQNKKKNGDLYWSQESFAPIKDSNDQVSHFIAIQEDISEAKKLSEQLNYQASHDPLTDLINRREFENRINRVISTAKTKRSVHVLCYLDLDHFKIINDTCTHIAGDELLKQFANILKSTFRYRDTVARLGGDEFAILLEHCSLQQAEIHAQELLTKISNFQFHWDNKNFRIGVSIGITDITRYTKSISDLFSHADIACYSAKNAGRNCTHIYQKADSILASNRKELQWISKINQALNENLFILYIQPICQLNTTNSPDHYEVLIRLQDTNGDIIPPDAFLPAVERFNLSLQLDQWVIRAVFNWIKQTIKKGSNVPCLSINISGKNLGNKHLLYFIHEQLNNSSHLLANKICFEITETAAINNLIDAQDFISELKQRGVKFSLDDFGSGLSSFDYLKNLPVDYLKIDGQFVKNIENDAVAFALVKSISEIGHIMGKKTIAEFVENKAVLTKLSELNLDYVQGYYIGKPKPLDKLLSLVYRV